MALNPWLTHCGLVAAFRDSRSSFLQFAKQSGGGNTTVLTNPEILTMPKPHKASSGKRSLRDAKTELEKFQRL